ncbi:MAG: glycosyltransferase [Sphaerochaetaceae bacterium]|nr:glycosyltransferase [Sphaerochaetaceae bacterium]
MEPFLERCLDSITSQTYTNLEIILIDDGSPDNSGAICEKYKEKDSRITVIHKENGGQSSARNAALNLCTGDYISFIDPDDFIEKDMMEVMVTSMKRTKADIAVCGRFEDYKNPKKNSLSLSWTEERVFSSEEIVRKLLLRKEIGFSVCDKLFKRELWENLRFKEGHLYEDMIVSISLLNSAKTIVYVGKPLYHYVHRENSTTTTITEKNVRDYKKAINSVSEEVKNFFPSIKEELEHFTESSNSDLLLMSQKNSCKCTEK